LNKEAQANQTFRDRLVEAISGIEIKVETGKFIPSTKTISPMIGNVSGLDENIVQTNVMMPEVASFLV
jgi:hypothetical protein